MSNVLAIQPSVQLKRFMDGSFRTFVVRRTGRCRHLLEFLVSPDKADELTSFVTRYPAAAVRATWRGETIIGHLVLNPIEKSGQPGLSYIINLEIAEAPL